MVLEDVTEQYGLLTTTWILDTLTDSANSDYTGATSKLPKILLNGNNICMASSSDQAPAYES